MKQPRMSLHTLRLLEVFSSNPESWRYGYDLSQETGFMSGTLYPLLMRLTKHGLMESRWVTTGGGAPRHMYRLTTKGAAFASRKLKEASPHSTRTRKSALQKGHAYE